MIDWSKIRAIISPNIKLSNDVSGQNSTLPKMWEPEEWQDVASFWKSLMSGSYTNPALSAGLEYWKSLISQGGKPVDVTGYGEARKAQAMRQYEDIVKEMAEKAGVGGVRYGSGLQKSIAKYGGDMMAALESEIMDKWLSAQESALAREYGAGQQLLSYGQLGTTGASALQELGTQRAYLPIQVAQALTGVGSALTSQQIDPYTQLMASLLGQGVSTTQTYQPSWVSNLMGFLYSPYTWGLLGGGINLFPEGLSVYGT